MEEVLNWLRGNTDVLGYLTAALIFLVTLVFASRKAIGFFITLLLLIFALLAGFMIANHGMLTRFIRCPCDLTPENPVESQPTLGAICLVVPEGEDHWICPNCKHKNSLSFVFCQACGWGN